MTVKDLFLPESKVIEDNFYNTAEQLKNEQLKVKKKWAKIALGVLSVAERVVL